MHTFVKTLHMFRHYTDEIKQGMTMSFGMFIPLFNIILSRIKSKIVNVIYKVKIRYTSISIIYFSITSLLFFCFLLR